MAAILDFIQKFKNRIYFELIVQLKQMTPFFQLKFTQQSIGKGINLNLSVFNMLFLKKMNFLLVFIRNCVAVMSIQTGTLQVWYIYIDIS